MVQRNENEGELCGKGKRWIDGCGDNAIQRRLFEREVAGARCLSSSSRCHVLKSEGIARTCLYTSAMGTLV